MSRVAPKSIDPREAQVDRRDDVTAARRARLQKLLAKSRKGLSDREKMEKLLREGYGERQAVGNALAVEAAKLDLPTSAVVIGKMSEKQRTKFAKMRARQEKPQGNSTTAIPRSLHTRADDPLKYQR